MSTPTDITPPPSEVQPSPRKPHRARKALLIIGSALAALILIIVVASVATSHGTKAVVSPSARPTPTTPVAQSFANTESLIAAMAVHGAVCSGVSFSSGGTVSGERNPYADCSGASSGDTSVLVFTDHASALAYANNQLGVGQVANSPTAEVVGPDWTVNTSPAFAAKVIKAVGGQLLTEPAASSSTPASTPTASPSAPTAVSSAPVSSAPALSTAEQQAVESAQSYLALGSGFSKSGLFKQLTSSYGAGFTAANANFAISYLNPDWDAQAVEAAKSYLALGGFSHDSLIQQLTSSYGAGFTLAQAEYAVTKVGL
jgi:hypothetical protein